MHQSLAAPRTCHALPRSDSCTMMVGMASSAATISGVRIHRAVRSAREAACVLLEVSSCVPFPLPVDISQTPPVFPRFVGAARAAPFVLRLPRPDLRCPTQDTEEQRGCEEHERGERVYSTRAPSRDLMGSSQSETCAGCIVS